jgi:endonuclease/exonuclease/phosphatase family metal-dependent hydrolase
VRNARKWLVALTAAVAFATMSVSASASGNAGIDEVTMTRADPAQVRAISWNICGEAGGVRGSTGWCPYREYPGVKSEQVALVAEERQANVLFLQEICSGAEGSHLARLQERLGPGWDFAYAAAARPDGRTDCRGTLTGTLSVALAVKGEITGITEEDTVPSSPNDKLRLPILCATVSGWTMRVCTTHLIPSDEDRARGQAQNVRDYLEQLNAEYVVGGDFNRNPHASALEPLDDLSRCIDGYTFHRWDHETQEHRYHMLDRFYTNSSGAFSDCSIDRDRMDQTVNESSSGAPDGYSDHAPIFAVVPR